MQMVQINYGMGIQFQVFMDKVGSSCDRMSLTMLRRVSSWQFRWKRGSANWQWNWIKKKWKRVGKGHGTDSKEDGNLFTSLSQCIRRYIK